MKAVGTGFLALSVCSLIGFLVAWNERSGTMTIEIYPEDEKIIQTELARGRFRSIPELIHQALVSLPVPTDWRTLRGMARGGESLTQALMEERSAEQAGDQVRIQGS
jgi:hypothetical protein